MAEDRRDSGLVTLQNVTDDIVAQASREEDLTGLFTSFRANTPWLYLNIDRTQAVLVSGVPATGGGGVGGTLSTTIVNAMTVGGVRQVQLDVTIASVNRTELRELGVNFLLNGNSGFFGKLESFVERFKAGKSIFRQTAKLQSSPSCKAWF